MPVYSLTSPQTGRTYDVEIDHGPDVTPPPEAFAHIGQQLDTRIKQQEEQRPFLRVGDTLNAVGDALGGLPTTLKSSFYRLTEGTARPDQYSPSARAAFDAEAEYARDLQQEEQDRLLRGESSSAGSAVRAAAPSLGFSGVTMGASLAGNALGRPVGALIGGIGGAPTGPGAVGTAGIGATVGGTVGGMALSGAAAYRMAANQFLDEAWNRVGKERQQKGLPWTEKEKAETYKELLPLAQDTGLWEAGPEAVGNAFGLAAGKYILGFGKKQATELAETVWKRLGKKAGALAGGTGMELGTETITQIGGAPAQAQAQALAQGDPNWQQAASPYDRPGGTMQALQDVAPATLAQSWLMLGMGGGVKLAQKAFQPASVTDRTATPPADQTVPDAFGGAGSTPAAGSPSPSPLGGIARRAGTVDVAPLVPGLEEDTGALTAQDVQDLERGRGGDTETIRQGDNQTGRQAILTNVPDRAAMFRDNPLAAPLPASGDVITDLRIPRSPQAIEASRQAEEQRLQKQAELRRTDAKAQGMPLIPDSPTGSRDILDWANENPIFLPPGFSPDRKLPEYDALQRNPLPNYWRQFVASGKRGGNPDEIAQRAFDAGLIAEPTTDAYMAALQDGIAGRKQYRVQFQQREKQLAQEEKRVVDFEKSQTKLAKKADTQQVPFEDIIPGDRMTIDGEEAVVRKVDYNEDGYLTNVVIEDGKRFGVMQFDPQNRDGILVDEYQPTPRPEVGEDFGDNQTGVGQAMSDPFAAVMAGTEGTRPRNRGETDRPQAADPLAELQAANLAGQANQAQGRLDALMLPSRNFTGGLAGNLQQAAAGLRQGDNRTGGQPDNQTSGQGDEQTVPASPLGERWWAATTREEARAVLEPASLEELKAITTRLDENPNQSKAKLIDRLVQLTGIYADSVSIRGITTPRGPMPDFTGQSAAEQQRMQAQRAERARQRALEPKERLPAKARPSTPEELARQMDAIRTTPGRATVGTVPTAGPSPVSPSPSPIVSLSSAYSQAARGSSSAMVPISRVYEQAKAQNPALTVPQFLAEVQAADQRGEVLLEPFDSPAGLQAAGEFVVRNASGVPSVNMAVPAPQGMTNEEGRRTNGLRNPAERGSGAVMASASGAAHTSSEALAKGETNEPSPGGLSEAEWQSLPERLIFEKKQLKTKWGSRYYDLKFKGQWYQVRIADHVETTDNPDVKSAVHASNEMLRRGAMAETGMVYPHRVTLIADEPVRNEERAKALIVGVLREIGPLNVEYGYGTDIDSIDVKTWHAQMVARDRVQQFISGKGAQMMRAWAAEKLAKLNRELQRPLNQRMFNYRTDDFLADEIKKATARVQSVENFINFSDEKPLIQHSDSRQMQYPAQAADDFIRELHGQSTIRNSGVSKSDYSRIYDQVIAIKQQIKSQSRPLTEQTGESADMRGRGLTKTGEGDSSPLAAPVNPESSRAEGGTLASPAELKAAQAANEAKLAALGLPTKPGTRIWAAAKMRAALGKIAKDASYPATMRAMADLLTKVNLDNLLLKVEADARLNFAGKYQPYNDGRGEISLNTRVTGRGDTDIVQSLVHELLHHVTYQNLRAPRNARQRKAKADMEKLLQRARAYLAANEQFSQFDYELSNLDEFITALFTRADFQTALANIPADMAPSLGKRFRSMLDEIFRVLAELVTSKDVPPGSVLEASMSATLRLIERPASAGGMTNGEGRRTNETALLNPAAPAPNETRSRFASPNAADRVINGPRTDAQVADEARAWLGSVDQQTAIEAFASQAVPLPLDAQEHAAAVLIKDLSEQAAKGGTEVQRMWAHVQGQRMARIWTKEFLSADPARALRQRGVVNNTILQPIAPILAAQETLIDRAEAVGKARFDGGWEGLVQKINDLLKRIENLVAGTAAEKIAKGDSTPSLKTLLNNLRRKMYPGMDWTEIFTDLPSTQKQRQLAIYERLMKDERLQGLTAMERLDLTNELDKAWQRERREVFKRELRKAGILGEKDAGDRVKVTNAMPKLLRLVNLGMFNSAMFREVIAPQYGLKVIDSTTAARLRGMAEAAYAQPEGVLRNRKLGELLNAMQAATGSTLAELVNSYWTAAVLSGTRTQWDTWMAFTNGMGTNLLQAAGLLARGRGKDAVAAHAAWWRGLLDGMRESLQILAKGDYSVLKRFGTDLNKALQGESGFRPVPLGESLWQNGNTWQKYFMAPVMIWTGRLMAAADHVNNTATTAGAMAVARALHPEFYGRTTFSETDRANARAQALREVTGGAEPVTAADKATVSVRVRELLYGSMREPERLEANEIGDMAAFQNDPTGIFGTIYAAMKAGLGTVQRGMEAKAQDMQANQWTRAAAGLMAGSLHGLTGTRFMRFGFNFGAELTRYVPGTALLDKLSSRSVYGKDTGPMQRELLLGKNVIGLMLGSTLAALFLNSDDDDEGWQIEGDWSGLTPQQVKERMSAGLERMTMWKRDGDTVRRVSYKQWPTMGLFAVVGGMLDEKRHKPAQFAQHGTAGHLGRALGTGMLQIKNVSAMRNLVELFGGTRFAGDPSTGIIDDVVKTATNFAGGFIPTAMKDAEIWQDPRNFKAEGWLEELQRSTPISRRFVNDGRPQLNLLGEEVKLQRVPWSRTITSVESSEASRVLGALLGRGLNLPQPSDAVLVVQNGVKVPLETLGREKVWQYEKAVGTAYKQWLAAEGTTLLQMPVKQAAKVIEQRAASIKRQALARVAR